MNSKKYFLGIDTSNYTTSVAITSKQGEVIKDLRKLLEVKKGEKGLRQQEALFQHIKQLPVLIKEALKGITPNQIAGVAASTRPRPTKDSYMPAFIAGESIGKSIAATLGVPFISFSHQEGHIEAALSKNTYEKVWGKPIYAFHMSGGTCELLKVIRNDRFEFQDDLKCTDKAPYYEIKIVGGSKDISFGQLLDRVGVAMGFDFPCGEKLDEIATNQLLKQEKEDLNDPYKEISAKENAYSMAREILKGIRVVDGWINLSGTETKCLRSIPGENKEHLIFNLFQVITRGIDKMTSDFNEVILVGGVSESQFIRQYFKDRINISFGEVGMGSDNAVGIARLGGKTLWL